MSDFKPAESASLVVSNFLPSPIASASAASMSPVNSFSPDGYGVHKLGYLDHILGRQIGASALNVLFSLLYARGDYRVNAALYETNPLDPRFYGWQGKFYQTDSHLGRIFRALFLSSATRGRRLTQREIEANHHHGFQNRNAVNLANLMPMIVRLSANAYSGINGFDSPWEKMAVWLDTTSTASRAASLGAFSWAHFIRYGHQPLVTRVLERSWYLSSAGNVLTMGAGLFRLGLEYHNYLETGEINSSTILLGLQDTFWGASGVGWAHFLIKEGRAVAHSTEMINGVTAQNHILLDFADPPKRLKWGFKAANGIASALGFGFSLYNFVRAANNHTLTGEERTKEMVSNGLGMASSLLMGASALMVGTALAPAAGIVLAGGMAVMIGQTVYDYFVAD